MKFQTPLVLAGIATVGNAHTIFTQLQAGGVLNPISWGIRDPSYDGPITDVVTTNDVACNGGPNPTTPSPYIINVSAGETVQATWRHGLTSTAANDPVYVIDPSHLGPVMAYMKKVDNATSDVGYGSGWFKITEEGYNAATGVWATTNLISAAGVQYITIPKCIANGQYLLRAELIALHGASSLNGAQFYMECAQINVSGGTGTATPSVVALPGAYASTDPGILINIYYPTVTSYTIPGPTPFTCPGGGAVTSTSTKATSTSTTATTLVTSTKVSSSSSSTKASTTTTSSSTKASSSSTKASSSSTKASTTTSSSTGTATGAPLYGQCGGDPATYTGPLTCAAGTCTYSNPYFSQCL